MAQPDHDTESQMADTAPDESGHDEARPLSDEGEPGRGSLATETVAGTVAAWLPARSWAGEPQA